MNLAASFSLTASGVLTRDDTLAVVTDSLSSGNQSFPSMSASFVNGTNPGQASRWHRMHQNIAAGATQTFDLAGSLTDPFGGNASFGTIKALLISIVDADATKKLRVGPQGIANAWQGPFGGTGAEVYQETRNWLLWLDALGPGWTVTPGTGDVLPIMNPGDSSLSYILWILGN